MCREWTALANAHRHTEANRIVEQECFDWADAIGLAEKLRPEQSIEVKLEDTVVLTIGSSTKRSCIASG